ncbi:MAG TPA: DMT family protein, partial [Polymorphobacter sp.]|nr:DMT family protein [Polymorphobacter sp.]
QVPANRIGSSVMTAPQLKGLQEIISILVFAVFSWAWLGQAVTPKQWVGFALIAVAAYLIVGD